jgi:hypothetical protein
MMKKKNFYGFAVIVTAIVVIAIVGIGVTSCSGPEGPMGPEGPQGPAGSTGSDGSDGSSGSDGRPAIPVVVYTITFDSGEDGSAVDPQKVMKDDKAHIPLNIFRPFTHEQIFAEGAGLYRTGVGNGWILTGWFMEDGSQYDFDKAVNADVHLTARWAMPGKISTGSDGIDAAPTDATFFDKALEYVVDNPSGYYLVLDDDYTAQTVKTATATGISLTIIGLGGEQTITSNTTYGDLFIINNGAQLHLESNIILKGKVTNSNRAFIDVSNGSLTMQDGSKITGYRTNSINGTINVTGTTSRFVMNGGEISGNQSTSITANAGIVILNNGGNFTMNGGTITENTVATGACITLTDHASNLPTFNMNGGTITGNTNTNTGLYPGGVLIQGTLAGRLSFSMTGGSITGNTGTLGDVYKSSGTINNNYTFIIQGTGVIGTLTVAYSTGSAENYSQIKIGGNWTGSVQVLNLYYNNATFATIQTQYKDKYIVVGYGTYTLTSADIDNFKRVNFMRNDFQVQNIESTSYVLVRTGADIGRIK